MVFALPTGAKQPCHGKPLNFTGWQPGHGVQPLLRMPKSHDNALTSHFRRLSAVFSPEFVDGPWKSRDQIQQESEDKLQQQVVEAATTDFLGRWRREGEY